MAYPVDKVIHSLNNCGKKIGQENKTIVENIKKTITKYRYPCCKGVQGKLVVLEKFQFESSEKHGYGGRCG